MSDMKFEHPKSFCVYVAQDSAPQHTAPRVLDRIQSTSERDVTSLADEGIPEVIGIGHSRYKKPQPFLPEHVHPQEIELHYCKSGLLVFEIGGVQHTLTPGCVCLTQPGVKHHLITNSKGDEHDWLLLRLPKGSAAFLGLNKSAAQTLLRHIAHIRTPILRVGRHIPELFAQIHETRRHMRCKRLRTLLLQTLITQLLIAIAKDASKPPHVDCNPRFASLIAHMRDHPEEHLSNAELARETGLCESRFLAAFKQCTGLPPAAYMAQCRIEEIKRRLLQSRQTLKAMALDLGYSSSFHLSTQFKSVTGFSPRQYMASQKAKTSGTGF